MIHHAMWIRTQAVLCYFVLLLMQILNRTDLSESTYLVVDSYTVVSKCFPPQHKVSCHLVQLCVVKYGMAVTCWP